MEDKQQSPPPKAQISRHCTRASPDPQARLRILTPSPSTPAESPRDQRGWAAWDQGGEEAAGSLPSALSPPQPLGPSFGRALGELPSPGALGGAGGGGLPRGGSGGSREDGMEAGPALTKPRESEPLHAPAGGLTCFLL